MDPISDSRNRLNDLADIVCKDISRRRRPVGKSERMDTNSIIKKFFEYAFLASIHGYKIRSRLNGYLNRFFFAFRFIEVKKIPRRYENRIKFSPKAFGYYFIVDVDIPAAKRRGFRIEINKRLMEQAIAITESDKVYDLINPKR